MSTSRQQVRRRQRRQRAIFVTVLVLAAFGVGIALGEALHDNPRPGGTQTIVLTFKP
jgi:hypothetical protein